MSTLAVEVPKDLAKALRNETRRKIIELLRKEGPMTVSQLARRLDMSKSTVHYHLQELKKAGFVDVVMEEPGPAIPKKYYGLKAEPVEISEPRIDDAVEYVKNVLKRSEDPELAVLHAVAASYRAILESIGVDTEDLLYELGHRVGRELARELDEEDAEKVLERLLSGIGKEIDVKREDGKVVVSIKGCVECSDLPYGPACHFEAGLIAGVLDELEGDGWKTEEVMCSGAGAEACVFEAERTEG